MFKAQKDMIDQTHHRVVQCLRSCEYLQAVCRHGINRYRFQVQLVSSFTARLISALSLFLPGRMPTGTLFQLFHMFC